MPPPSVNWRVLVAILLLTGWIVSVSGGPASAAPPGRKLALLVGVNEYDRRKFDPLEFAERDVEELASELRASGYEVRLLLGSAEGDRRATRANVELAVDRLLQNVTRHDLLLLAFAGHGQQLPVKQASGAVKEQPFFCPRDAEHGNTASMVNLGELLRLLDNRGGGANLVLVDACRNDPDGGRGRGVDGNRVDGMPENTAVFFSCSHRQRAYESRKAGGGHGIFFHFVLEGLRGRAMNAEGEVTWGRLVEYVQTQVSARRVKEWVPSAVGEDPQTPHNVANFLGRPPVLARRGRSWTMLGGSSSRNRVNLEEHNLPTDWSVTPGDVRNVKWQVSVEGYGWGEVVVHRGKVFVGTAFKPDDTGGGRKRQDCLLCLSEESGRVLWRLTHPHRQGFNGAWEQVGICSTPCVVDDRVYYITGDGLLVAADAEGHADGEDDGVKEETTPDETRGDIVWQVDLKEEFGVRNNWAQASSALVIGDQLVVATGLGRTGMRTPRPPAVVALDRHTGKTLWTSALPELPIKGDAQWGSLAHTRIEGKDRLILAGADGWLHTLDASTGAAVGSFQVGEQFVATPVVQNGRIYAAVGCRTPRYSGTAPEKQGPGALVCVRLDQMTAYSPPSTPVAAGEKPPLAPAAGSPLQWVLPGKEAGEEESRFSKSVSTCLVHDSLVYAVDLNGRFHCLREHDGEILWIHDTESSVWGSPFWADGKIYLGTKKGEVFLFAHGREKRLMNRVDMKAEIASTPVAVNGVLYVRTAKYLYAIGGQP